MERFNFVGPGRTLERETDAAHDLAQIRKKKEEYKGLELEKTAEELAAIDHIDDVLKAEFRGLRIAEIPEIRPDRFIFVFEETLLKIADKDFGGSGIFRSFDDVMIVCRERLSNRLEMYETMLHEGVHMASHKKHWLDVENRNIENYRVGYRSFNMSDSKKEHEHFRAFNEGVTELTVEHIFYEYKGEIAEKLSVAPEELEGLEFSYELFRSVVAAICEGIATHEGIDKIETWKRIKRGQFTGEMMHLRRIEQAYGFGALDVLDALEMDSSSGGTNEDEDSVSEKNEKILEFFKNYNTLTENKSEIRKKLMDEILGKAK